MKKIIVMMAASVVVVGTAFWIGSGVQREKEEKQAEVKVFKNRDKLIRDHSPAMGPENAPVVLVEFLDPECEACRAMYPVVKQIMGEYPDKIRLVVRYLPLHKNSVYAANVLEIARSEGKFWEALEIMFLKQPEWASHDNPKPELLKQYMTGLSVDLSPVDSIMLNSQNLQRIEQDREDSQSLGVDRTPTFFVNGEKLRDIGYEPLKEAVERQLPVNET